MVALVSLVVFLVSTRAFSSNLDPRAETILKKARDFISDEATLNQVRSLRFEGTITGPDGDQASIVINLQQPYKLLQALTREDGLVEEFGLNDYEGWLKRYHKEKPDVYGLMPVDVIRLKRLRANTYEGLNFFSTKTNFSRKIDYLGEKEIKGKAVDVIKISYGSAHFIRYFDKNTGELLLSEIESGESIEEQGEMMVDGIRFPKYLITRKDGKQISHLEFHKIEVNPALKDSLFTQPALPGLTNK